MILLCKYCGDEFSCLKYSYAEELELCTNCYILHSKKEFLDGGKE